MKNRYIFLTIIIFILLCTQNVKSQDIEVYMSKNYEGESIGLNIGDFVLVSDPVESISFVKHNPSAALLVEALENVPNNVENWDGEYKKMFYYSDEWNRSGIGGTDQYGNIPVKITCVNKRLPEPDIYVPIDADQVHPGSTPHSYTVTNENMLYLKRAFFWENSEDLRCDLDPLGPYSPHGPAGDIKIKICHKSVADYSLDSLNTFQHLWEISEDCYVRFIYNGSNPVFIETNCNSRFIEYKPQDLINFYNFNYDQPFDTTIYLTKASYHDNTLYGPVYISPTACDAAGIANSPVSRNEWIDGPWGTFYSNVAVVDWNLIDDNEVTILITEADVPIPFISDNLPDVMGAHRVKKNQNSEILINVGMFGWIILKNEVSNGKSVEYIKHYWYPVWDAQYPELVLGSSGPIKHFENDSYTCLDVEDQCGAYYSNFINDGSIVRVIIDTMNNEEYKTYFLDISSNTPIVFIDTIYSNLPTSDSIIIQGQQTSIVTPSDLYRRWGSQYQPYYSFEQIMYFVPSMDSIGIYGGTIPSGNFLNKEFTFLPLDYEYSKHKEIIDQYAFDDSQGYYYSEGSVMSSLATNSYYEIYPNPTSEKLILKTQATSFEGLNVSLWTLTGIKIQSYRFHVNHNVQEIDISSLQSGIYLIKIDDNEASSLLKFVKTDRD